MTNTSDFKAIVDLLVKKERASAADLGTDRKTMKLLEEAGAVRQDGFIKSGKKGKPPAAFVIENKDAELPVVVDKPSKPSEIDNKTIEKAMAEVRQGPYIHDCTCISKMDTISYDVLKHHPGCKTNWICSALDSLRRKVKLNGS